MCLSRVVRAGACGLLAAAVCWAGSEAPASISQGDLVINEIHADPAMGSDGDANQDGTRDFSDDEFLEIVNVSGVTLDLVGLTIRDTIKLRHAFSSSVLLEDCEPVVVFGGGGGIAQYKASTGTLALNNDGDHITLRYGEVEIAAASYGSEGGNDQSLTRFPELTGSFRRHTQVGGSIGLYSPGTRADGSAFVCPCTAADGESLTLSDDTVLAEVTYEVCETIALGPSYGVVGPHGHLVLRVGDAVAMREGFSVGTDARLTVDIDPGL